MDQNYQDIHNIIISYPDSNEDIETPNGFDIKNFEPIICIELINNNYIYLQYEQFWTIEDLILKILHHKETIHLYPHRQWQLTSKYHTHSLFELHLSFYSSIKEENLTKVDHEMTLGEFINVDLLKNRKHPFFIFKDNRNIGNLITTYENKYELYKRICKTKINNYSIYKYYLPKVNTLFLLKIHPELGNYFIENKKNLNTLSPYKLNPLLSCENNVNWFSYDNESMLFLSLFETKHFNIIENIKYGNDGKIYLEDKLPKIILKEKDLDKFYLKCTFVVKNPNIGLDNISKKINITLTTTGLEILENMSHKLEIIHQELAFEPNTKILKVRSLNDYILNLNIPLVRFAYINNCIVSNTEAEYIVIDNPFNNKEVFISNGCFENGKDTEYELQRLQNENLYIIHNDNYMNLLENESENDQQILSIASYNNKDNIINDNEINEEFEIGGINEEQISFDVLDNVITTIEKEIQLQTKKIVKECFKIINDQNDSMLLNESSMNMPILSQKLSVNSDNMLLFHNIPQRQAFSKKINPNDKNISNANYHEHLSSKIIDNTSFLIKNINHNITNTNIFIEENKTTPDISEMIRNKHEIININTVIRPFSIIFRQASLTSKLNSFPYNYKKSKSTVLSFCFRLYIGKEPISSMKKIIITCNDNDLNPIFNKRIYFDLHYNKLPPFVSLNITLKHMIFDRSKTPKLEKTISWANYRLFDHKKRLKTGKHKVTLLNTKFTEDSFFYFMNNINDKHSNSIYFEIDSFLLPLQYEQIQLSKKFSFKSSQLMTSKTDDEKIIEIINRNPFEELNNYDKELLWKNRYQLSQDPLILSKLLKCIDYTNILHLIELEKILSIAKPISPIHSIELLTGQFLHESIRRFAVKCLFQATPQECELYLIQLIQGLKYEMYHDNELSRYLLLMAITYPLTIGHNFFWHMRSELDNPLIQQRFILYLKVFFDKIGNRLQEVFINESLLVSHLIKAAEIPHKKGLSSIEEITLLQDCIMEINDNIEKSKQKEISLPFNFKYRGKCIKGTQCGIFNTKDKALFIVIENCDPTGKDFIIEYKIGIDLRKEIVSLQLFKIMQRLWYKNKIKTKMSIYHVMKTNYNQGMIEIIKNSKSLSQIYKEEGGVFTSLSKSQIVNWFAHNGILSEKDLFKNFFMSCLAYCVATFILGINDRNTENMFIKTNGEIYSTNFKQLLGFNSEINLVKRYKKNSPFFFTKHFMNYLGGERGKKFWGFKIKMKKAYDVLRNNVDIIIVLLRILLTSGLPEVWESSLKLMESTLCLNLDKKKADEFLNSMLEISLNF